MASPAILPLPAEVVARIKSSAAITSLNGVVLGLLSNSLDAGAVRVEIDVNFRRGDCTVEDDGAGISPAEFREDGGLAKMYYTSKFGAQAQMHGRNGTFLSCLTALSLVTITSHHHLHRSHNTLSLHQSKVIARLTPSPAHQHLSFRHHGTRVTVRDLFGNMPVRVKQRALASAEQGDGESEWGELKRGIVGLLLGEGRELSLVVRDAEKDRKFVIRPPGPSTRTVSLEPRNFCELRSKRPSFDLSLTRSILSQASYIQRGSRDSWVPLSASTPYLSIHGAISLDPAPTKRVQFIALGVNPVCVVRGNNMLFEEVNRLFAASGFGAVEGESDLDESEKERRLKDRRYKSEGCTKKQLKGGRKGVDRWPMFFLRINLGSQRGTHPGFGEDELLKNDNDLRSVLELLGVATTEFLMQNHFRPRIRRAGAPINGSRQDEEIFGKNGGGGPKSGAPDKDSSRSSSPTFYHAGDDASAKTRFILPQRPSSTNHTDSKSDSRSRKSHPLASQPDMLGNNVRLPSFSGNATRVSDPAINSWSRVRSGKRGFLEDGCGTAPILSKRPSSRRTSQTLAPGCVDPAPESVIPSTSKGMLTLQGDTDLRGTLETSGPPSSGDGDQNVAAFAESLVQDPGSSGRPSGSTSMLDEDNTSDALVPWINQSTNGRFLINLRTGMASVASKDLEGTRHRDLLTHGAPDSLSLRKRMKLRSKTNDQVVADPNSWIGRLLENWNNPVFRPTEEDIPQVSLLEGSSVESSSILHGHHYCSQVEIGKAFRESISVLPERLSKEGLRDAEVIAQVDRKFILAKVATSTDRRGIKENATERELLVIIDQHAADERCRIENLLQELCTPPSPEQQDFRSLLGFTSRIATAVLPKPITFHVSPREHRLFKIHAKHFADWGILYDLLSPPATPSRVESEGRYGVVVKTLPPGIVERCKAEVKLVLELLRGEAWSVEEGGGGSGSLSSRKTKVEAGDEAGEVDMGRGGKGDWLRVIGRCPRGILDMLNSRSCRSAVMFNDELCLDECKVLVSRLVECKFPFQCAHGRPSIIPLVDLSSPVAKPCFGGGDVEGKMFGVEGGEYVYTEGFIEAFRRWRSEGMR